MEEKIFKYLNNEMPNDEKDNFEKEIETNSSCKEELEQTSLLQSAFKVKFIENVVNDDMIEDYLNNSMSDEEKTLFESRLNDDDDLRTDLEFHSLLKASIITRRIRLAAASKKINWRLNIISSVAVLTGFALVGCGVVNNHNGNIADDNYNAMKENIVQTGSRGTSIGNILTKYELGNIDEALAELNEIINKNDTQYNDAMYFKGIILLKEKWFSREAVECLEKSNNSQARELLDNIWLKFLY